RGGRHAQNVLLFVFAVVRRPVEQAVFARHRQQDPDAVAVGPAQEVAGSRLDGCGEVGGGARSAEVARELHELLGERRLGGLALTRGADAPAAPELRTQGALAVLRVVGHAPIVGDSRPDLRKGSIAWQAWLPPYPSRRPSSLLRDSEPGSCPRPRRCRKRCCPSSTSRRSSTSSRRRSPPGSPTCS